MKKLVLILSIIACYNLIVAQDIQNYHVMVHMIDSMKTEYSVKELINSPMVKRPYQYRTYYKDLTEEYQNKVIDRIYDLYAPTEYLGLYSLASVLLDEYYYYSEEEVRKKIIDIWFEKRCYSSFSITNLGHSQSYSEKTKQRLLDILSKKWTQEDIAIWEKRSEQALRQYYINDYKSDVQKIMKETNRHGKDIETILLDSIVQDGVNRNMKENINRPVSQYCILMIGSLNDPHFIPSLERILEENNENAEMKKACTYALAKLGVRKYIDEIYNSDYIPYRYLGTKEALLKYIEKKFNWNVADSRCSECGVVPQALMTVYHAARFVKNVPEELRDIGVAVEFFTEISSIKNYDPSKDEENKKIIQKVEKLYQWFFDNKDNLELQPVEDRF
ncbi:MAG: hypothetical protein LBG92_00885 [Prevotellaceae bacterium]|nr:hypothetical protein [Prevotellaceae bacterium]